MSAVQEVSILDRIEARILEIGGEIRERGKNVSFAPAFHHFTPGLYTREIFMPAGSIITSEMHKTEHPYVVSAGRCYVYVEEENRWTLIQAPYFGITKSGTRRLLIIVYDTVWTTFHVTDKTDVEEIENDIFARVNPLLKEVG